MGMMEKTMETIIVYWGYMNGILEKRMETIVVYWGYIMGMMEKKLETIVVYWGYIMRIMEKKMEIDARLDRSRNISFSLTGCYPSACAFCGQVSS